MRLCELYKPSINARSSTMSACTHSANTSTLNMAVVLLGSGECCNLGKPGLGVAPLLERSLSAHMSISPIENAFGQGLHDAPSLAKVRADVGRGSAAVVCVEVG